MNNENINEYLPSLLNPRTIKKEKLNLTQKSIVSRCSLSLKRPSKSNNVARSLNEVWSLNKENFEDNAHLICTETKNDAKNKRIELVSSTGFSAIDDIRTVKNGTESSNLSFEPIDIGATKQVHDSNNNNSTLISVSSVTELNDATDVSNNETIVYDVQENPVFSLSFCLSNCNDVNISSEKSNLKRVVVSREGNNTNVDCELAEGSHISEESANSLNMNNHTPSPTKRKSAAVNLEIKKQKLSTTEDNGDKQKVLILNTNAIEKLSHVIVQPPNYKLVKRKFNDTRNFGNIKRKSIIVCDVNDEKSVKSDNLRQKSIDTYFKCANKGANVLKVNDLLAEKAVELPSDDVNTVSYQTGEVVRNDARDMSKNLSVADVKCDVIGRAIYKTNKNESSKATKLPQMRSNSPRQDIKASSSEAPRASSPRIKRDSAGSYSPRKNVDSIQFSLPLKSKSNKTSIAAKSIPHYKIVAGTHFAVDAFSYGEIPNVKHYFLTHFHSDHYSGLKKSFNKLLFCSKITADLCVSRLGVNVKCIQVINVDETMRIEGVEVTAVDANHCPGAIMLVFTLPNGKALLHTGDFRASPIMESYPVFWNKDIHTIYLDTTYCNPRYDFPTQDQSLEMALYLLRQKKMALEKAGKKFSSVLIVCGTYTIGKEKFFLGMARRVGCSVWACPEKDRVLRAVEGRSFSHAPPHACQLHVVPMRDLTHEKLKCYLDSLQGAFSEVVAFKPSGWENGKNSSIEKDSVTIHGIPYSEHSSFSELIRFVKYLKPKQVVPTVDISGGIKSVQKYFPCPLVNKDDIQSQSKVTDYFSIQGRQQVPAVT